MVIPVGKNIWKSFLEHPNEECQSWVQADLNEHLNIDRSTKSKSKSVGGAIMFSLNMYKVNLWTWVELDLWKFKWKEHGILNFDTFIAYFGYIL